MTGYPHRRKHYAESWLKSGDHNMWNDLLHLNTKSGRNPPHIKHGGL